MKKNVGRPKLPEDQAKQVFSLRLSKEELASVESKAAKAGKKPREWARERLLE